MIAALLACADPPPPAATEAPPPAPPVEAPVVLPDPSLLPVARAPSPMAIATTPEIDAAKAVLRAVVDEWAIDPANPWAIAHAMLVRGAELAVADRGPAADFLFAEYAVDDPVGGRVLIAFPESRGATRIEPHADLLLKSLAEQGVRPDRRVRVGDREVVAGDLWRSSLAHTWVEGDQPSAPWNDLPWTVSGLALWAPPGLTWTADGGRPMSMDTLTSALVRQVDRETRFLAAAAATGQRVEKRGQGIFQYTCGGAHLIQGAGVAVGRGFGVEADRVTMRRQLALYLFRLQFELPQIDAALQEHPEYRLQLITQRLKFLGHLVETAHGLAARGVAEPTPVEVAEVRRAERELLGTVGVMQRAGVFASLRAIRAKDEQMFLDVVGDSAHALRGLDLATGATVVR